METSKRQDIKMSQREEVKTPKHPMKGPSSVSMFRRLDVSARRPPQAFR